MIKQAIIPLAGLGTRLLPLTSVMPKELLPLNGRPALEYILDECLRSGIKEVICIISKKKEIIKKYFFNDSFYRTLIKKKKNNKNLRNEYAKIKRYKKMLKFVYQDTPRGTGDAILKCKNLIKSNYFLMLMPDDLIINTNCSSSLIKLHKKYKSSVIASKKVDKKSLSRWGIFKVKKINKNTFNILDVIEKPTIKNAPSNYAVIGRYILPSEIFNVIKKQKTGHNNEIHITDSIRFLIKKNNQFIGYVFKGKYLDCGTMKGYLNSTLEISKL